MTDKTDSRKTSQSDNISKIDDNIYIGPYEPAYNNHDVFQNLGIDVIVNCAKEICYGNQYKYIVEHIPMEDDDYASMLEYIDEINDKMRQYLELGKKIYLHSVKSTSRAPAILIYYLMSNQGYSYDDALYLLQEKLGNININHNFERELRAIEEG